MRAVWGSSMSEESVVRWLVLFAAAALVSCAAPKAVVVAEVPDKTPDQGQVEQEVAVVEPAVPRGLRKGTRLPANFTAMPDDAQFRSGAAGEAESSPSTVTARPPNDPVIPPDIGPKPE